MHLRFVLFLTFFTLLFCCQDGPRTELHSTPSKTLVSPELTTHLRPTNAHIRGLFLISDMIGWASGTNGTVLRMTDGWNWISDSIPGYTHLDFRDIHGFDSINAVVMAAGDEGRILRTSDGGETWIEVFTDLSEGIFLDGMDFHDSLGICYGDPLNGTLYGAYSQDYGKSWIKSSMAGFPPTAEGEAGFAASGTGIVVMEDREYTATGGGPAARVIRTMRERESDMRIDAVNTPLKSEEGCGIFSLAFKDPEHGVAVGGCYLDSLSSVGNCAITSDAGNSWTDIDSLPPNGYRSCVAYSRGGEFYLTSGRSGIDISFNNGRSWGPLSDEGYFTCALADSSGWLMGRNGKLARISW